MDKKELEKKLNQEVKPGTESVALGEAQSHAGQLLTEQRMNLETEKQIVTSNAARDTELRGAVELGAMNSGQAQQVALPPQAAGLRPETQEILSKYGVNPKITESSRSNSNSTQTRSSNVSSQSVTTSIPKVTNTTNITNITNNNVRNETEVDVGSSQLPPRASTVTPVAVKGPDETGKFRIFLNNLFSKRDQERRIQEKEFRKRDWSIKKMTDKVLERMGKISETFSRKMNPENVGKTFMSHIKLLLGAVGLTLLPKVWPALISGVDKISTWIGEIKDTFTSTNGGFFDKVGAVFSNIGKGIVDSIGNMAEKISVKLAEILGGERYVDSGKGVFQLFAEKLASFLSNGREVDFDNDNWKGQFGEVLGEFVGKLKDILDVMMEERSEAIKEAKKGGSITNLYNLPDIIGAAFGGFDYLRNSKYNEASKHADDTLQRGGGFFKKDDNFTLTGKIKNEEGVRNVLDALTTAGVGTGSVARVEGSRRMYEYYTDKDNKTNGLTISKGDLDDLLNQFDDSYRKDAWNRINEAIKIGAIRLSEEGGWFSDDKYLITRDAIPTFLGIINGMLLHFNKDNLKLNSDKLKSYFKSAESRAHLAMDLDKRYTGFSKDNWVGSTEGLGYGMSEYDKLSNDYSSSRTKAWNNAFEQRTVVENYNEDVGKYNDEVNIRKFQTKLGSNGLPLLGKDESTGYNLVPYWNKKYNEGLDPVFVGKSYNRYYSEQPQSIQWGALGDYMVGKATNLANNALEYGKSAWNGVNDAFNYAMYDAEISKVGSGGYQDRSGTDRKVTNRTIRDNNPGNIRGKGSVGFASYNSLDDGYAAMFNKLTSWINEAPVTKRSQQLKTEDGKPVAGNPADTINKIIRIWAPAQDKNNEEAYVSFLENYTGINRDQVIDPNDEDTMKMIASGITIMEHLHGELPNERMITSIDKGWNKRNDKITFTSNTTSSGPISRISIPSTSSSTEENSTDIEGSYSTIEGIWDSIISMADKFGGEVTSNSVNSEIDSSTLTTSIERLPKPDLTQESISEYIEDKEDKLLSEESHAPITNITNGGNTSVSNSGNTTIINYNINGPRNSYMEVRGRNA